MDATKSIFVKMNTRRLLWIISFIILPLYSFAAPYIVSNPTQLSPVKGYDIEVLEDKTNKLTAAQASNSGQFKTLGQEIPNLGISGSAFWLRFSVQNATQLNRLLVLLEQPMIDELEVYTLSDSLQAPASIYSFSKTQSFYSKKYKDVDYVFDLNILPGETKQILIRFQSAYQNILPISIGTRAEISDFEVNKELLFGIYAGIILVMGLYNLFVYFTVRDKSYLLYVLYIVLIGLTQITQKGFAFKYLWPEFSWLAYHSVNITSCLVSIVILEFVKVFLRTKEHLPRLHYGIPFFNFIFFAALVLTLINKRIESFQLIQLATALASLYVLFISYKIYRLNYRPARFFMLAWSILLIGAIIFVLKDVGVVPYNIATAYAIQISSVAEVVLLSFALADKINILRREKEESQAQAFAALEENSRIIREQNVILENKVAERTHALTLSNEELNKTLHELKEAEMQLVEQEKMASLGQLTAGIAHEINNPINFVTSNVKPLKRDVEMVLTMLQQVEEISISNDDVATKQKKIDEMKEEYDFDYLKTEIDYLLKGITEGSTRTAEIVKGLRIFSRLDEDDLKKASINEGLDSTLIIVNNLLDNKIDVVKNYGNIPMVECYPGKLNQVFLNIITNGIHALKQKYKDQHGGAITISTSHTDTTVIISIKDNGTGMDENTKKKLFEPFFTTKDVGEGTGLGLSIAYNTIKKHNGTIGVNSVLGEYTEFVIEIPINQ
jgi:signal transduction histidine kinase